MNEDLECILYSEEALRERVAELGAQISRDFAGESLLVVGLLRGALVFMADLVRNITLPVQTDFIEVSSYGNDVKSSGTLVIRKDLSEDPAGRHVLLVDDILDSGFTLSEMAKLIEERGAASVSTVALLRKKRPNQLKLDCPYTGFVCEDKFVVGYGLDYAQDYRNLPYIGVLKRSVYS